MSKKQLEGETVQRLWRREPVPQVYCIVLRLRIVDQPATSVKDLSNDTSHLLLACWALFDYTTGGRAEGGVWKPRQELSRC
jgi:hypothetical protein